MALVPSGEPLGQFCSRISSSPIDVDRIDSPSFGIMLDTDMVTERGEYGEPIGDEIKSVQTGALIVVTRERIWILVTNLSDATPWLIYLMLVKNPCVYI